MPCTRLNALKDRAPHTYNYELSPYQRGIIIGRSLGGEKTIDIARDENLPPTTVRDTLEKRIQRNNGASIPREGRPPLRVPSADRRLLQYARFHPKATWRQTLQACHLPYALSTAKKVLAESNLGKWRAAKRPYLEQEHVDLRLQYALQHITWTPYMWDHVIWSDECSVERGKGKSVEWVFCTPQQKWDKEMISTYNKGKQLSIMVWAAFSVESGRSDLVVMARDPESRRGGYSTNSYLQVLDDQLPRLWQPGLIFMQDNAPIHTAHRVRNWFNTQGIPRLNHPPYSPDLNPIEHVWRKLKEVVYQLHPELIGVTGETQQDIDNLINAILEAWEAIPGGFFEAVSRSMPDRLEAVRGANGWQTRY